MHDSNLYSKPSRYWLIFSVVLMSFQTGTKTDPTTAWKLRKDTDGIKVYTRLSKNSNRKELKTVTRYQTTLPHLVKLVGEKENYPKWVYGCSKSYLLKKINENETYHYQETGTPWPLSNRDMIIHTVVSQDSVSKVTTITSHGVPGYLPPVENVVRIPAFNAYWKFTPLEQNFIEVEYFMSLDPGGDIPDWVVNLAVSEGPVKTLNNMKATLTRQYKNRDISFQ